MAPKPVESLIQANQSQKTLQLGAFRVTVLDLGRIALDGGAMFGVVPKILWQKLMPPDDQNRVPLALNCPLIEVGDRKILLETGVGNKFDAKHRSMYGLQDGCRCIHSQAEPIWETSIENALKPLGLTPEDITDVLFTHLHFDHIGGATFKDRDGQIKPRFANARHWIHQTEWDCALTPNVRSKASYILENFAPLEAAGLLKLTDADCTEIVPGLTLRTSGGHTAGHQIIVLDLPELAGPDKGFVFWGDLIPTRHHVKIPYVMGYDEYPMACMEAKRYWLKQSAEKGWLTIFDHDPDEALWRLTPDDSRPDSYVCERV